MLRFKEFITEIFLIEGRVDDLKAQNPVLHREIDQYAAADTTPTKKFVPWLVSQHKRGNVTPDHPDLHAVIQNFDRYKARHGIQDHSAKSFQDVHAAVMPLIGAGVTKAQVAHEGRLKIHDTGDIQAYHVQTKEASQHFYGGGDELGGDHTTWCVASRSDWCHFGGYGKMYTIHAKNDPNSPYAVHPEENTITTRHNDGDKNIDDELSNNPNIARLKPAIVSIQKHYDPLIYRMKNDNDISEDEINDMMKDNKRKQHLLRNPNPHIVLTALQHRSVGDYNTEIAVEHPNPQVAMAALNHRLSGRYTVEAAVKHSDPQVALAALKHNHVTSAAVDTAAKHPNLQVVIAALDHSKASVHTRKNAVQHPDPHIAIAALNHPKSDDWSVYYAAKNKSPEVVLAALNHKNIDEDTVELAANHAYPEVAMAALNHPKANAAATERGAIHRNPQVAMTALNHSKANKHTYFNASMHLDPDVRARAKELMSRQ